MEGPKANENRRKEIEQKLSQTLAELKTKIKDDDGG